MFSDNEFALTKFARDRHQVFTFAEALQHGMSANEVRDRVQSGTWVALHRGVFTFASTPMSFERELMAAVLAGGPKAFASGRSSAQLRSYPGGSADLAEVTCPRWKRARRSGVVIHERTRILIDDLVTVDGIRCSRPELMLIEIAAVVPWYAERVFHALRRERLATYASIHEVFVRHARRGTPGIALVRELLERYEPESAPTESDRETTVLQLLRKLGFPAPETQVVVTDARGRFVGRADFAYRDLKIAILYHSTQWHSTDEDVERDDAQETDYARAGWIPVVIRSRDVRRGGQVLRATLSAAIATRRAELRTCVG